MKQGDMILINGALNAVVRAIRTQAGVRASLPMLSEEFVIAVERTGGIRVAVIMMASEDPELHVAVIIETASGWKTIDGLALKITRPDGLALASED